MRFSGSPVRPIARAALIVATCVIVVGCGDRGPRRHRVSGSVTFGGDPVTSGRIVFDPDVAKGNSGPQGFAWIRAGRYDTADRNCRGTVGGPQIVTIDGLELKGDDSLMPSGRLLFPTHEERIELPKSDATRDFDVPRQGNP